MEANRPFRPMLAATADLARLRFPLLGSPKLDGIRAITYGGRIVGRSLKPIPNMHIQKLLGGLPVGLDGELIVGDSVAGAVFSDTSSGVMSVHGEPDVSYHVFDSCYLPSQPYSLRLLDAANGVAGCVTAPVRLVEQTEIASMVELEAFEAKMLGLGFEGVMLRAHRSPYKYGRGTVAAQDLLKLKRFSDAEAVVLGFDALMHNDNKASVGLLGQPERSHSKAGMVAVNTLGALHVRGTTGQFAGAEFRVGTGFDAKTRQLIWDTRKDLEGAVLKYKFFPLGAKDAPRFPVFIGWRNEVDL